MNEVLGYIKSVIAGFVLSSVWLGLSEMIWTGLTALAVGFLGASGGAIFRLIQNAVKRAIEKHNKNK